MSPIIVDLPHRLGAAEARRRIESGLGGVGRYLPAGAAVTPAWQGNRLDLEVAALGQEMRARIDVMDAVVRVEVVLPPALAFFGKAVEAGIRRGGAELLEDRSGSTPRT